MLRRHGSGFLAALVALTAGAGALRASNVLTATPSTLNLTCNTATGPTSTTVVVKPVTALTGTNQIIVSVGTLTGGVVVTPPSGTTLNSGNSTTGLTYTVTLTGNCTGVSTGAPTFNFKSLSGTVASPGNPSNAQTDVLVTVNTTLTATTSGLTVSPTGTIALTCGKNGSTYVPGPSQVISVTSALTGGLPFTVDTTTNPAASWLSIVPTTGGTATGTAVTFTIVAAAGCGSFATNTTNTTTIHLLNAPGPDKLIQVSLTVSAITSQLVPSATAVNLICSKSGSTYTPGEASTISVTSAANGGTAFTIDTTTNPFASWLSVTPTTGGTASTTPVKFTVVPAAGCGSFALNSVNTTTIHLLNAPAPDKLITVTMTIVSVSPLTASPSSATISYVKGSGTPGYANIAVSSTAVPAPFFSIDTTTLPSWLTVDSTTGTAPKTLRFSSTSVSDSLPLGSYSANVRLQVSGFGDLIVSIGLLINNPAPKLSVVEGTTRNLTWTIGNPLPTPVITAESTDTPIAFTVTTGGTLQPVVSEPSGLAYNFGTQIGVTFNPLVFAAATPNSVLTGTVTLTWGSPASTIVVTFNITVLSPGATITGLNPATLPTALPGGVPFQVSLTGTGFVPGTDVTQRTKVGLVVNGAIVTDPNISVNIINPSNMTLTVTVNASDNANLPFSPTGAGGTVTIGVCNPAGGTCSVATGTAQLTIGNNPIISAITSASSFVQVTPPALPTVAPYDMISIWGANFCTSGGTGCSTNTVLFGQISSTTESYPTQLTPDTSGTIRQLSVSFLTHGTTTVLGVAPLLFATNSQINALVPTEICPSGTCPATVDVVVTFGNASSSAFQTNVAATDPGLFTIGADGQGNGAILDARWDLIGAANNAGMRNGASGSADSDTVQIYMTGLGIPDSDGSTGTWSATCTTVAGYLSAFNTAYNTALTSPDGTLILPSVLSSGLVPCLQSGGTDVPSVTVGGVAATVTYAGWAPNLVAGLYQVNAQLPASTAGPFTTMNGTLTPATLTGPVQLPIVVTSNGVSSQAGVAIWVAPRLLVAGPDNVSGRTGTVGAAWPGTHNVVTAQDGVAPYTFAVTSGLLPSGVSLDPNLGAISGIPAANTAGTYTVTVTATDSVANTGSVTFTLKVNGGLYLTSSGTAPYHTTNGTANASVTTVTAASGVAPYTYALSSAPAGFSIGSSSGVLAVTSAAKAGRYHITATASDSTAGTPLTGSDTFDVYEALAMSQTAPASVTGGTANASVTTVTAAAAGLSGSAQYSISTSPSTACLTVGASTGVVAADTTCTSGTVSVTVTATDSAIATGAYAAGTGSITFSLTIQ
ncbi:MAG TPA: putative Ig domain-containing protein [Bryobacteraceae bacterium]|nr:putative Ig domain-containing protein [Bryobacteraceae bacterium]